MNTIVVLASGNGGNFKFLYLAMKRDWIPRFRFIVIADRDCGSVRFASQNDIENHIVSYNQTYTSELRNILDKINPDVIISNWHKIIDHELVLKYRGRMINLHYSLLPAFGGLIGTEPIARAYAQGCKYIGPTCHYVDTNVDSGEIISQAIFSTSMPISEATQLMFRKGCVILLDSVLRVIGLANDMDTGKLFDASFCPQPCIESTIFTDEFWQAVACA